jgi:hypothetical protein
MSEDVSDVCGFFADVCEPGQFLGGRVVLRLGWFGGLGFMRFDGGRSCSVGCYEWCSILVGILCLAGYRSLVCCIGIGQQRICVVRGGLRCMV